MSVVQTASSSLVFTDWLTNNTFILVFQSIQIISFFASKTSTTASVICSLSWITLTTHDVEITFATLKFVRISPLDPDPEDRVAVLPLNNQ